MARYAVSGKSAATAATIDNAAFGIWNPSTTKRIKVLEIHMWKITAGAADEPVIRRTTARGTATLTVTPTSVNEMEQIAAPPSGFLLDLTYSAQPTFAALGVYGALIPGAIGAGLMWVFQEPIEIPSANGIAVTTGIALAMPALRATVVVED